MKTPATKIEAVCSSEKSRYSISEIQLDAEAKQLIATNGHILAVIPAEVEDGDTTGLIQSEAIRQARKLKAHRIAVNGSVKIDNGVSVTEMTRPNGTFPNWKAVMPKEIPQGKPTVTLDAELLLTLALALKEKTKSSNPVVNLYVKSNEDAVYVTSGQGFGLIMPCRV